MKRRKFIAGISVVALGTWMPKVKSRELSSIPVFTAPVEVKEIHYLYRRPMAYSEDGMNKFAAEVLSLIKKRVDLSRSWSAVLVHGYVPEQYYGWCRFSAWIPSEDKFPDGAVFRSSNGMIQAVTI